MRREKETSTVVCLVAGLRNVSRSSRVYMHYMSTCLYYGDYYQSYPSILNLHTMQSFLGGADCAANANPLSGMMKREGVDRSVLRVRRGVADVEDT